jgi:predicted SAM-dependent methyltransferase
VHPLRSRLAAAPGARRAYRTLRRAARARPWAAAAPAFESLAPGPAVDLAYDVVLGRRPDPAGVATYRTALEEGTLTHRDRVQMLAASPEFENRTGFSPRTFGASLHAGRCRFIKALPVAARIVDLGGTSLGDPRGALVGLGYPYRFDSLTIVDLPSEERHEIYRSAETGGVVHTERGPVTYRYHSMADLSGFDDASVELVYCGQSIEHVPPDVGAHVLKEAWRILAPGGHVALDTPNGRVTRLQQAEFIDPDHEVEYTWPELRDLVEGAGFRVAWRQGINYAGRCLAAGRFDAEEVANSGGLYSAIEDCYLLAVVAAKDS